MEKEKLNLIVLAGLLHDAGKLFERGKLFEEARTDDEYLKSCPVDSRSDHCTHLHAAHTAAFCDWLEEKFDCLSQLEDKHWKIWCAAHHRNDETSPEASVIRISDRLSSSERDEGTFYQREIHRRTLLEPVLERVSLEGYPACLTTIYRFAPVTLTSERNCLFPVKGTELLLNGVHLNLKEMEGSEGAIKDTSRWHHLIAEDAAPLTDAYRDLGEHLISEIESLSNQCRNIKLTDLIKCLMTLLERYTANVPSATNLRHPDISLFDHMRTTAAIAQSLFLQFSHEDHFRVDLDKNDPGPRWLLVCGDFSGIQKFIYNLTNKGAAKGLRGRSFYVTQFCRICADYILRRLKLTPAALLYNSGGKFYLLIPAYMKKHIYAIRSDVNDRLLDEFGGDVFFGLGCADVTANLFSQGRMNAAWETSASDLEQDRFHKFREQLTARPDFFEPQCTDDDPSTHCRICGRTKQLKESERGGETFLQCKTCRDMERLGRVIADTEVILTLHGAQTATEHVIDALSLSKDRVFTLPIPDVCCLMIPQNRMNKLKGMALSGECAFLNEFADKSFDQLALPNCGVTSLHIGRWKKGRCVHETGDPWEFDDYADSSEGIKRLGILRMDVDNLGMIFIKGLDFPQRTNDGWGNPIQKTDAELPNMASISRMVTLSRQMNHFFSGYLPQLIESESRFDKCQMIYAGGDDLFIIGSWDQLPELAEKIREEFRAFCCRNPVFSISGAVVLQHGKYPIYKGAQLAGIAEKKAKDVRASWGCSKNKYEKNGFYFLGQAIVWEDFEIVKRIKALFERDMNKNRGLLSFLSQMTAENARLVQSLQRSKGYTTPKAWNDIAYAPWKWRAAYQLRRRYGKDRKQIEEWSQLLCGNKLGEKEAKIPVYAWLETPLRWTEFFNRK